MVCSSSTEARLVEQLSSQNAGFRVNGTNDDSTETIESMIDHVGRPLKSTLCLCEGDAPQQSILANDSEWIDVEFEVALDSGSTDHVCHSGDVLGYVVEASPGSRAGQGFIVGNGARVPNDGQAVLNLQATLQEHHGNYVSVSQGVKTVDERWSTVRCWDGRAVQEG